MDIGSFFIGVVATLGLEMATIFVAAMVVAVRRVKDDTRFRE